jgi:hypothetical protein
MIPRDVGGERVCRLPRFEVDVNRTRRVVLVPLEMIDRHATTRQLRTDFLTERIHADATRHNAATAARRNQLVNMAGHVQRRAAENSSARQHIEKRLAQANDSDIFRHASFVANLRPTGQQLNPVPVRGVVAFQNRRRRSSEVSRWRGGVASLQ